MIMYDGRTGSYRYLRASDRSSEMIVFQISGGIYACVKLKLDK